MILTFKRIHAPERVVSRAGDVLTINGVEWDFSPLPEGGVLPRHAVDTSIFFDDITRVNGALVVPLFAPHASGDLPQDLWFPSDLILAEDGPVEMPPYTWNES